MTEQHDEDGFELPDKKFEEGIIKEIGQAIQDGKIKLVDNNIPKTKLITAIDLIANVQPPKWRIDKLLPAEGVTYLGGNSNSMKTFIALYLALCITSGKPVFGKFPVIQSPVIYIDLENGQNCIGNRVKKLLYGHNEEANKDYHFLIYEPLKIDDDEDGAYLRGLILSTGAKVVIIDSLVRAMCGDENSSRDVSKIFDVLKTYCLDIPDLCIVIIHHFGKKSTNNMHGLRGSSDIAAMASMVLTFSKAQNSNFLKITIAKNRWSGEDFEGFGVKIVDIEDKGIRFNYQELTTEDKQSMAESAIIELLQDAPQTQTQLIERLQDDHAISTIRRAITNLVADGRVLKPKAKKPYKINPNSSLNVTEESIE